MGFATIGSVVLIKFPYSNFKSYKLRPALVVGLAEMGDLIVCQITSNAAISKLAVGISDSDFKSGRLPAKSFIRPDKLFTISGSLVATKIGVVGPKVSDSVKVRLGKILGI